MFYLKIALVWLKENWKVPLLITWTVIVWALSKKNAEAVLDVLEAKKESYDKQIIAIKESHRKELSERDKLLKQYHDTIDKIEKEYSDKREALTRSEKTTVKKIVEQSKGDPDVIKQKIKNLFNIPDIN